MSLFCSGQWREEKIYFKKISNLLADTARSTVETISISCPFTYVFTESNCFEFVISSYFMKTI